MPLAGSRGALLCALLAAAALAFPAAASASFGVQEVNFEAGTCTISSCTYASPTADFYTQAAGHPPFGVTSFELNHKHELLNEEPEGALKRMRVDVPPGLAADPEALPNCSEAEFDADKCSAAAKVGTTELVAWLAAARVPVTGDVYNLAQPPGLPLEFGIHVEVPLVANEHILLKGHVAWSSDYHEYFEIDNLPKTIPILKSKLIFVGTAGNGNFLTLPSVCSSSTTSYLEVESYEGQISRTQTHTPVGVANCGEVPFEPDVRLNPASGASDQPSSATAEVQVPQYATTTNSADVKDLRVLLPEGMTLNPSAAHGLQACTPAQIAIGTTEPVTCPAASEIGHVTIETDLPPGSLAGSLYLGAPTGLPIKAPPYAVYLDAESTLGVSVRLKGEATPNPNTGRLEVSFLENPQLPFSDLIASVNPGPRAPLANPLACGAAAVESSFTPYTGLAAAFSSLPFTTTGCASPIPFTLAQSTSDGSNKAGDDNTSYSFDLSRPDGQQYLSSVHTVLPAGLLGLIPSVARCGEPQAQAGTCPPASLIGTADVSAGAGSEPYAFSGPVYLTGPYGGAPYGLSIPVAASAGPFDLGTVVTRVAIGVDEHTARVIATSNLPTIVGGIPLRLRGVEVTVTRPHFLINPTSCRTLTTDSTLGSTFGATDAAFSALQMAGCSALAFHPSFRASTSSHTSKLNGASLQVTLTAGPHEANLAGVVATLPVQLPARLTTLQKACLQATFDANRANCPGASYVGGATVTTPVLPDKLSGPAYLVSHGGAEFPDLDIVLEGDGVRVILHGTTVIKGGAITSSFSEIPDVPVSRFSLTLAAGPHSALAANGSFCAKPLVMPTTLTAQSGAQLAQSTRISVAGCPLRIVRRRVVHHKLLLTVQAYSAGRLTARGTDLRTTSHTLREPATFTLRIPLTRRGAAALRHHRSIKVRVNVRLRPLDRGEPASAASTRVTLR